MRQLWQDKTKKCLLRFSCYCPQAASNRRYEVKLYGLGIHVKNKVLGLTFPEKLTASWIWTESCGGGWISWI